MLNKVTFLLVDSKKITTFVSVILFKLINQKKRPVQVVKLGKNIMENLRLIQISNTVELLERAIEIAENMIADFYRKWQEGIISKFDYVINFKKWEQNRIDYCLKLKENSNFNVNKKE